MKVNKPVNKNIWAISKFNAINTLASTADTAMKSESLIFEQAITPETLLSGALVCMTAYSGTMYKPPKNAIANKHNGIGKLFKLEKNC